MNLYWCAVKGMTAADVPRVFGPGVMLVAPSSSDTILGASQAFRLGLQVEPSVYSFFTKGDRAFFLAPRNIFDVKTMFPDRDVIEVIVDEDNEWTSAAHWINGETLWSAYGDNQREYVDIEGTLPEELQRVAHAGDHRMGPIRLAHKVTGFRHDKHARPRGFQRVRVIVQRELHVHIAAKLADETPPVSDPTDAQVHATLDRALLIPGSWITLTILEREEKKTIRADYLEGGPRVELDGRVATVNGRKFDKLDVRRCFADFFDEGRASSKVFWSPKP